MRNNSLVRKNSKLAAAIIAGLVSSHAVAISYGTYDARGLAMGGTTVAAAKTHQAQFYNPALLALHEGTEEETPRDGRFVAPIFMAQFSDNAGPAAEAIEDNLDSNLANAVDAFNTNPSAENAGEVARYSRDLQDLLDELVEDDVNVEAFSGFAVSEPSDWEGGAFYFGFRLIGLGSTDISQADLDLLESYIVGMEVLADGGDIADLPPEIVNPENGSLLDPTQNLNSTADISALGLTEWGVSMSTTFDAFGYPLAVGITPKVLRAIVYREQTSFDNTNLSYDENRRTYTAMNVDAGVATQIGDHFRVGFAVKDLIPENYASGGGLEAKLRPRSRLGVAWVSDKLTVGMDYDLQEFEPVAGESPNQDLSLGVESTVGAFSLQLGYKQDMAGETGNAVSGGVAFVAGKFAAEFAYMRGDNRQGGAIQLGWRF